MLEYCVLDIFDSFLFCGSTRTSSLVSLLPLVLFLFLELEFIRFFYSVLLFSVLFLIFIENPAEFPPSKVRLMLISRDITEIMHIVALLTIAMAQ